MNPSVIPLALCMAAWQANAAFGQESVPSLPVAYETLPFEKDAVVAGVPGQALLENFITHEQPAAVIPALLHFINRFPQDPYTPRLTFAAGEILLQAAKYAEALEMFERLDAKEKSDPFVWLAAFRTGECLVALGRLQEAHAVWRGLMVTEANGYRPALAGSLAWLEMRLGFYAQARERLQAVLSEYPELEQEVSFREALGTACFMQEDWATALSWLDGLADPQARALRGLAAKALDRGEEAEQDVRAALGSGTAGPMMLQIGLAKLAEWNIGKNAFAAAEYLLTVLTASFPGTWCAAWGNLHLAALALEQGNPMHAQNSLSAASFWPEDSHLRGLAGILEAQIAMRRQDFQAALKIWNQLGSILLLREEHAYARLGSLISELSLRRFAAADTHVKLFLKQFPQSESRALVEYLQAWMYAQAGKTMAATEIFQNIVLNDPYSSVIESALMQMAELGYRNRNWNGLIAKTAKLFETLQMNFISAHPEFRAWTAFFLAEAYLAEKKFQQSFEYYSKAVSLAAPGQRLGQAARQGWQLASRALQRSHSLHQDFSPAPQAGGGLPAQVPFKVSSWRPGAPAPIPVMAAEGLDRKAALSPGGEIIREWYSHIPPFIRPWPVPQQRLLSLVGDGTSRPSFSAIASPPYTSTIASAPFLEIRPNVSQSAHARFARWEFSVQNPVGVVWQISGKGTDLPAKLFWNGLDQKGRPVAQPGGYYTGVLKAFDASGQELFIQRAECRLAALMMDRGSSRIVTMASSALFTTPGLTRISRQGRVVLNEIKALMLASGAARAHLTLGQGSDFIFQKQVREVRSLWRKWFPDGVPALDAPAMTLGKNFSDRITIQWKTQDRATWSNKKKG